MNFFRSYWWRSLVCFSTKESSRADLILQRQYNPKRASFAWAWTLLPRCHYPFHRGLEPLSCERNVYWENIDFSTNYHLACVEKWLVCECRLQRICFTSLPSFFDTYSCLISGTEWFSPSTTSSSSSSTTSLVRCRTNALAGMATDEVDEVCGLNRSDVSESVVFDLSLVDEERLNHRVLKSFFSGNSSRMKPWLVTQHADEDWFARRGRNIFDVE